jgi:hypothetical protein
VTEAIVPHTDQVGAIRYKLVLGKYPITRVEKTHLGFDFCIQLPNGVKMIVSAPPSADVKEGDILTLYTEVLANAAASIA